MVVKTNTGVANLGLLRTHFDVHTKLLYKYNFYREVGKHCPNNHYLKYCSLHNMHVLITIQVNIDVYDR